MPMDPESTLLRGNWPKSANFSLGAIYLGPRSIAIHSPDRTFLSPKPGQMVFLLRCLALAGLPPLSSPSFHTFHV